jgi:hypothetical protein
LPKEWRPFAKAISVLLSPLKSAVTTLAGAEALTSWWFAKLMEEAGEAIQNGTALESAPPLFTVIETEPALATSDEEIAACNSEELT